MDDQASRIGLDLAMTEDPQGTANRPVVAVVDDDRAVCGSLKFALELEGFAVRNCFVIDQRMPEMTGMELVEVLRERLVLTPVILIISHPNAALSARARNAAIPIVEKPFLGNALVERIREACWA
jgi:FixJ family two-component response regulator